MTNQFGTDIRHPGKNGQGSFLSMLKTDSPLSWAYTYVHVPKIELCCEPCKACNNVMIYNTASLFNDVS